jgi:hypothetical protein
MRELEWVCADLLSRDGPFLCRAFDYSPDRMNLAHLAQYPDGAALGRSRVVLLAGRGAEVLGYALLEIGAEGVNIFSLYDACRLIVMASDDVEVRDSLFLAARCFYRENGRNTFLLMAGPRDAPAPGGGFEAEAYRAVVTGNEVLELLRHLDGVLGTP